MSVVDLSWKTLDSVTEVDNEYVTVKKNKVQLPNGEVIDDFYTVKIQDAALIVALTQDDNVLLKTEYRYACQENVIECPAGMIDNNELPEAAAKRELLEETGYISDDWTYLGATWESTSKLTNKMHLFLAKECIRIDSQHLDKSEHLEVLEIVFDEAIKLVMSGKIKANSSAHAILKVAELRRKENI